MDSLKVVVQPESVNADEFENELIDKGIKHIKFADNGLSGDEVIRFIIDVVPHAWNGFFVVVAAFIARGRTILVIKDGEPYEIHDADEIKEIISKEDSRDSD